MYYDMILESRRVVLKGMGVNFEIQLMRNSMFFQSYVNL